MKFLKNKLLLVSCFLFFSNTLFGALVAGILVKTKSGFVSVDLLKVGDTVISCKNNILCESKVFCISESKEHIIFLIELENDYIYASQDQYFYDVANKGWVKAKNLTDISVLLDSSFLEQRCLSVTKINQDITTYDVSLNHPHTFFVSNSQILTNNVFPVVAAVSFAFGGGISLEAVTLAIGGIGVGLWNCFGKKRKQPKITFHVDGHTVGAISTAGGPIEPDDGKKKKRKTKSLSEN